MDGSGLLLWAPNNAINMWLENCHFIPYCFEILGNLIPKKWKFRGIVSQWMTECFCQIRELRTCLYVCMWMTLLDYFSGGFAAAAIGEAGSLSPCISLASNTDMSREQLHEAVLQQAVVLATAQQCSNFLPHWTKQYRKFWFLKSGEIDAKNIRTCENACNAHWYRTVCFRLLATFELVGFGE